MLLLLVGEDAGLYQAQSTEASLEEDGVTDGPPRRASRAPAPHVAQGLPESARLLVEYLQRYTLRHLEKDLLARTYVAIDEGQEGLRLAGYFSLSTVSVERSAAGSVPGIERLPRFPIPGVLLARLAVDQRVQGPRAPVTAAVHPRTMLSPDTVTLGNGTFPVSQNATP